jgi:hypothetical protein
VTSPEKQLRSNFLVRLELDCRVQALVRLTTTGRPAVTVGGPRTMMNWFSVSPSGRPSTFTVRVVLVTEASTDSPARGSAHRQAYGNELQDRHSSLTAKEVIHQT